MFFKITKIKQWQFFVFGKETGQFTLKIILSVSVAINETLSGTKAGFNTS